MAATAAIAAGLAVMIRPLGAHWRWARDAIEVLVVPPGTEHRYAIRLAVAARDADRSFGDPLDVAAGTRTVLTAAAALDDGGLWHAHERFRSYADASLQAVLVRAIAEFVAERRGLETLDVLARIAAEEPSARPALIAHAEALLDTGRAAEAARVARLAHSLQAACLTSERLLLRALRADPVADPDAPELRQAFLDLSDRTCVSPFSNLSTGWAGETFACFCPAWVPYSIGNIHTTESPDALWNSEVAQEIRRSVIDGDFSYCSRLHCSFIAADLLPRRSEVTVDHVRNALDHRLTVAPPPQLVELNHDPTCNLACPSCRTDIVTADAEQRRQDAVTEERVILPLLRQVHGLAYISGGGEPFSSPHYRSILKAINRREFPGLAVDLISNGLLITPERWRSLPDLSGSLFRLAISIDAASEATYERLRPPGRWSTLRRNLDFVAGLRQRGEIPHLRLNFVVQRDNFREIPAFLELGREVGADELWFQRATNYGTYDAATFAEIDVASHEHPQHAELIEILLRPEMADPTIDIGMLLSLLPEVAKSPSQDRHLLWSTYSVSELSSP